MEQRKPKHTETNAVGHTGLADFGAGICHNDPTMLYYYCKNKFAFGWFSGSWIR